MNNPGRLLMALSTVQFERVLREWIEGFSVADATDNSLHAVSIDGKTLCGTLQPHCRAVRLLCAPDHRTGCVLSQANVDHKTNEAKAALSLWKDLVLKDRVIIGDAIFCQRNICREVLDRDGHYLFAG